MIGNPLVTPQGGSIGRARARFKVERVEARVPGKSQQWCVYSCLSRHLGCDVRLVLIPYARSGPEQVELLRVIAQQVESGDRVHMDITHGYRHLPMLILLAALHLRTIKGSRVEGIWYGSYDQDEQSAAVHDLQGVMRIASWIDALSVYNHTSDYSVFSGLIGGEAGGHLANAAFFESINRIGQARGEARKARRLIEAQNGSDPAERLFRNELLRRLEWAEQNNFYRRQRELALEYLEHGRYLESALVGYEAFITTCCRRLH
jgi:CRISPR-associated DxTHG motif protein